MPKYGPLERSSARTAQSNVRFLSVAICAVLLAACAGPSSAVSAQRESARFPEVFDGALSPLTAQYSCAIEDFRDEIPTENVIAVGCFGAEAAGDISIVRRSLLEALRSSGWDRLPFQNPQNIFPIFTRLVPDHQCPQLIQLRIVPGYSEHTSTPVAEFYTIFLFSDEPPCEDLEGQ